MKVRGSSEKYEDPFYFSKDYRIFFDSGTKKGTGKSFNFKSRGEKLEAPLKNMKPPFIFLRTTAFFSIPERRKERESLLISKVAVKS
jgi:hypothetical protein